MSNIIKSLKTGLNPRSNFKLNTDDGLYPYITGKDIFDNSINVTERTDKISIDAVMKINKRACLESGDLLFASTGTGTVGRMAIIESYDGLWNISESIYAIKVDTKIVNVKYLMYVLYSKNAVNQYRPRISKASVPHLKVSDLMKVKVPIPCIQEQERIVDILDKFDKICNDIFEGLPAEINARNLQYKYYLDKLMTFKECA